MLDDAFLAGGPPDEHYRRAAWVTAPDLDDPSQDRSHDETDAAGGAAAMRVRSREALQVTHTDDLARSIGVPTPDFPPDFYHPVAHLLVRLAAERHGQGAVTSALRQERMPKTISAF